MTILEILIGFIGLIVWLGAIYCLCFHKIYVDRLLTRGKYSHVAFVILLIAFWLYGLTFVAYLNDVEPYDLLFYDNLYGRGTDYDSKRQYRQSIIDRITEEAEDPSLFGTVFYHFRGLGTEYNAGTPKGRYWAFFISLSGIVIMGGILLPCVLRVITRRGDSYIAGQQRYNIQKSPYAVIFGAHETVPTLVKRILSDKHTTKIRYVIVHTSEDVASYRHDLETRLTKAEERHIILYRGTRTNIAEIESLHIERAKEVYILGEKVGNETESSHDSMNMECVRLIAKVLSTTNRSEALKCYTMFEYNTTYTTFLYSDLSRTVKEQIEFIYLNYNQYWAQKVLSQPQHINEEKVNYSSLEGNVIIDRDSDKTIHLVIVGMSKMGMSLAIEAAYIAHYPNFCTKGKRTKITFFDPKIENEMQLFLNRYPDYFELCRWRKIDIEREDPIDVPWHDSLNEMAKMKREGRRLPFEKYPYSHLADPNAKDANFIDVEWEFIKGSVETFSAKEYLTEHANNENEVLTVAVCINSAPDAVSTGMYLPRDVYRNAAQVLVCQKQSADVVNNISGFGLKKEEQEKLRYNRLRPFGMLADCFDDYIVDNRLAKLVNFVYNCPQDTLLKCADEIDKEKKIPRVDVYWRNCSVSNQWSSRCNASSITTKLRFLGLDLRESPISQINATIRRQDNIELLAEVEHNRWNTEKLLMGFRPLNDKEIAPFLEILDKGIDPKEFYEQKNAMKKGWEMAHLNICSFEMLKKYDKPAIEYDIVVTKALPVIVEWIRDTM